MDGHHATPSSASREGGKSSASVLVVKTGKKGMDYERYLDATQRYVPPYSYLTSLCNSLIFAHVIVIKGSHEGLERLDVWRSFESEAESDDGKCQRQRQRNGRAIPLVWWVGFNICTFSLPCIIATAGITAT